MRYKLAKQLKDALAKQLKDAGWEQELNWGDFYYDDIAQLFVAEVGDVIDRDKGECKAPTLSELIDATTSLQTIQKHASGSKWWANSRDGIGPVCDSPEEAVAKLWIKLNETNTLR